ncbi:MAG: Hpt domain-containing protein, partial [Gammaproteobacteria bacterium]|nr:Hpt domain-containing protein [Gammaproteobacteria bacterium]
MIEDPELNQLFRAESGEYLQSLELGLLQLENSPLDTANLNQIFRDAHSLKGASRILDLRDLEQKAHEMEESLKSFRAAPRTVEAAEMHQLYSILDTLKVLVDAALDDDHEASARSPSPSPQPEPQPEAVKLPPPAISEDAPSSSQQEPPSPPKPPPLPAKRPPSVEDESSEMEEEMFVLFQGESETHIGGIQKSIHWLEKNPEDQEALNSIFQHAHSLKGVARILGLKAVEDPVVVIEQTVRKLMRSGQPLTSEHLLQIQQQFALLRQE